MLDNFITVVGVNFRESGQIYYYSCGDLKPKLNDKIIVKAPRGISLAKIIIEPTIIENKKNAYEYDIISCRCNKDDYKSKMTHGSLDGSIDNEYQVPKQILPIIRLASKEDLKKDSDNKEKAVEAKKFCQSIIKKHKIKMKILKTEYTLNADKLTFFYISEERIEFKLLIKELLKELRVRVELRQVDTRDTGKLISGIADCGQELCCARFARSCGHVSIKMAKIQGVVIRPSKTNGHCGKMKCCLSYEVDAYKEIKRGLPKVGKQATIMVDGKEKKGKVVSMNIFTKKARVFLNEEEVIEEYSFENIVKQ